MRDSFDGNRAFEMHCWQTYVRHYAERLVPVVRPDFMRPGDGEFHRGLGYDVALVIGTGREVLVELKCERTHTGNLFLETWSNKAFGRSRDGWMFTCKARDLWYFFEDTGDLYMMAFRELWEWAFGPADGPGGNIYRYPERRQRRHEQANSTLGCVVPVGDIRSIRKPCVAMYHKRWVSGEWRDVNPRGTTNEF